MEKIDFKKVDKPFYTGKAWRFDSVDVPKWRFLSIDGTGNPNVSEQYNHAITALYGLSYPLKFHSKKTHGRDYVVGPLEGLWWADDMDTFIRGDKDSWKWRMMIRQPSWQNDEDVELVRKSAIAKAEKTGGEEAQIASLRAVRVGDFTEGPSVQVLHVGPYSEEGPVIAKMHNEFLPSNGLTFNGHHHEIYLSDVRKVAPEKLKTILRQPVKQVE